MKLLTKYSISIGLFLFSLVVFISCQKEINPKVAGNEEQSKTVPSIPKAEHQSAQVAVDWYKLQLHILLYANPPVIPPIVGRAVGYIGVGLYESVRHGIKNSKSLSEFLYQMPPMPERENNNGYSWEIAANAALAKLVRYFYSARLTPGNLISIDSLETEYNEKLKPSFNSAVFERSQSYGRSIAEAIINWSKTDNESHSNAGYIPPVFPGSWVPTPSAFASPLAPYLGNARPFLQVHAQLLAPPVAFPYSEDPSSDFYKMVKDIYDVSKTLTDEQRTIALFWNDVGVGTGVNPTGHAVSVLNQILEKENPDLGFAAEAYAKLGIGLREGFITCFRSKYAYNLVRPVTYIRKVIDASWLPLINTPSHPEYPAAHAQVTGSGFLSLTGLFGDNYAFTDNTYGFLGWAPRNYSSLFDVASECGNSRRYGGIHYLPSINIGLELGRQVGQNVANIQLIE